MRDIEFRGKRTDNGEWVYGNLVRGCDEKYSYVVEFGNRELCRNYVNVDPETIGQYTGLKDKNGKRIFEGDIVKSCEYDDIYFVRYFNDENYPAFDCVPDVPLCECNGLAFLVNTEGCEIIGNIYDNPKLLRGDTNA